MTRRVTDLIPEWIRQIDPYRPGKPIEEVERELKLRAVKLASNENPLGPSPKAVEAARAALAGAHRYPDAAGYYLREKLAARHGVPRDNLLLGLGSSELIDLAARALLRPSLAAATSQGSFPLYSLCVRAAGARIVEVAQRDHGFDLEALAAAAREGTRLVYIANPNNPTGTMFPPERLEGLLAAIPETVVVVLDEAYCDYVEGAEWTRSVALSQQRPNLVVLRTFSKVHGLAGLRIGYGMGPADLLGELNKLRTPFNTSSVAQAAALAALDDHDHVRRSRESNRAGLAQLSRGLAEMGVAFVPSVTNFLLVDMGEDARPLAEELMRRGVIVRPMRWMGFPDCIRVSVGTAEENQAFLTALGDVRAAAAERCPPPAGPGGRVTR